MSHLKPVRVLAPPMALLGILTIVATLGGVLAFALPPSARAAGSLVCIDPGHGGSDPGASTTYNGQLVDEKSQTLLIAQDLSSFLTGKGFQVVMTRATDVSVDTQTRTNICNGQNQYHLPANVTVSIHLNASSNATIDYTLGLYGKKSKDYNFAAIVNQQGMGTLSAASGTGTIQNNGITNYADGLLLKTTMPATLAETVFLTSTQELALLTNGTGQRQHDIALTLCTGIATWFAGSSSTCV